MSLRGLLERLKKLDNYRLALLLGLPISFSLLILLLASGALTEALIIPEWLYALFLLPSFIGNFISGGSYLGRLIDSFFTGAKGRPHTLISALCAKNTLNSGNFSRSEFIFTLLGFLLGLGVTLAFILTSAGIGFIQFIPYGLACAFFALGNVAAFAGLGNRFGVGVSRQCDKLRLPQERYAMLIAIAVGLIIGIVLAATMGAGLIPVAGITGFFLTSALPGWLTGTLFTLSLAGTLASATDYFSRAICYGCYLAGTKNEAIRERVKNRLHEYRGAFLGVSTGIILSGIAVGVLLLLVPHLFVGICGVIALTMVVVAATSIMGGLFSRIGRFIDGLCDHEKVNESQDTLELDTDNDSDKTPLIPRGLKLTLKGAGTAIPSTDDDLTLTSKRTVTRTDMPSLLNTPTNGPPMMPLSLQAAS